ncbi:hypothetical protein BO71DRAFT_350827 [Aspergillus ellipticus CBS 707.79]|uniref:Endo-1,4-beta-xylanase n=1 Tax=Aspergillus ellipticus CBS 707.79 TaxID=1448320 RepID=A0A319DEU7_9EURO|nr:hypothetical protein BO71DRAFT_350827 [Aspergillus ellipticus CBS 707.79]
MVAISSLALALSAATSALALPNGQALRDMAKRGVTANAEGTNNGFFYSFWSDGTGDVTYTNGDAGEYTVEWTDCGDFVAGKGWNPGSAKDVTYSGSWETNANSYLSVYGWTEDPLIEFYINEKYGDYDPASGLTELGTVESDGGTYKIYQTTRTDASSVEGTATFKQYWSVRTEGRTSGTVTTQNHFDAWEKLGLEMGTFNYMIVAVEGYESSGSATITVESSSESTNAASSSSSAIAPASSSTTTSAITFASSSTSTLAATTPATTFATVSAATVPTAPAVPAAPSAPAPSSSDESGDDEGDCADYE